jgi:predicted transcriptional regulator
MAGRQSKGTRRRAARASANGDGTALSLRALRERFGRTQGDVAKRVSMTQSQLSRVEARRDHLTSTLRRFVRALGGQIEIVAVVKGARIPLRDV